MHPPTSAIKSTNEILGMMEAGKRYTVKQLAARTNIPLNSTDVLFVALQSRSVRRMQTKGGPVFWIPSERELAAEARHLERCQPMSGSLSNYGGANDKFRDLCMLTRR